MHLTVENEKWMYPVDFILGSSNLKATKCTTVMFQMRQSIQECTTNFCGRQPLKIYLVHP